MSPRGWVPSSFRGRLMLLMTLTLTLTVLAICALQLWLDFSGLRQRAPQSVATRASVLAASLEGTLAFEDPGAARERLEALRADGRIGAVTVYRLDGTPFVTYRRPASAAPAAGADGPQTEFRDEWLLVRVPLERERTPLGTVLLAYDLGAVYADFWRSTALSVLVAAFVVALALLVVARVERQLAGPVTALADVATRVSETGDYGLRAEGSRIEELQRLADGFNTMMARIDSQARELRAARDYLEQRVAERAAESEQRAMQLRALAVELTQTEERERRRLAHALHDDLQQLLVAARMHLEGASDSPGPLLLDAVGVSTGLIQDAIAVSRSLTTELAPPVLYDGGLGEALRWMARSKEEKYGLRVRLDLDPREGELEESIKAFLFRAVKELLFNVVKHAGVGEATVRARYHDGMVALSVEDAGSGFDPRAHERKVDRGFGLFGIRERLEYLGGRLDVRSEPGAKTTITMHVPRKPQEIGRAARLRDRGAGRLSLAPRVSAERLRVLLVDDHKILRDGVAFILDRHGELEVVGQAASGPEAIELAHRLRPDVVVMDVSMPGMSGIEATRRISAELPEVRVVGLSMHDQRELGQRMLDAGAAAYLTKGGPAESLIETILRVAS